jgi:hypothetical protein
MIDSIRSGSAVIAVCAGALLPSALASGAFLHVRPSTAPRGSAVVFTGSVAQGCARGDQVTLISRLFPGHAFGGEGAITTRVGAHGRFTRRFSVGTRVARGTYVVTARCGGGNLGVEAKLRVR